ncbi:MAG: T9SS type A sorting domain-containing protein, partial [Candidatus Eisenbacteria bacterium]|nr:T9SS type A sorting domain-containing protein [Candidatus Eisenbacteria bacterium]
DNQAASASFTICNYDGVAHTYSWGASALAPALGCSPGGASSFLPSAGTVTVPAQSCVTIPIDIACPTGINAGSLSCWQVSVYNHDTGNLFGCRGSVRRPLWWCPKVTVGSGDVVSTPVLVSPTSSGRNVTIEVQHIGLEPAPGGDVSIQILALDGDGNASEFISLDGLPPGEPIIRQVTPGSDDELLIDFVVDYVENQPIGLDRIELLIDDDMDGAVEPVAMFFTQGSEAATVGLDDRDFNPDGDVSARPFLTLPNPFSSSGLIQFQVQGNQAKKVTLGLYDLSGRRIKIFHRKDLLEPGIHSVDWDGTDGRGQRLASGVYFLRLDADEYQETVKVVLMK